MRVEGVTARTFWASVERQTPVTARSGHPDTIIKPTVVEGTLGTIGVTILLTCVAMAGLRPKRGGAVDSTKNHAVTA